MRSRAIIPPVFQSIYHWFFPKESASLAHHSIARMLFLRGLGVIYLIAILSWWVQVHLLVGENGLVPASSFLAQIDGQVGFFDYPTLFRITGASDLAIHFTCAIGCILAISLIAGFFPGPALAGLWILYLSFLNTGSVFMSFQWDILLLETGFLAIWFAPWRLLSLGWKTPVPLGTSHRVVLIFFWVLIAKLMFFSGWVKLAWAGPNYPEWSPNHTAMSFHYFTQPLPTWTAWWAHQLPEGIQKFSLWPMYLVELVLPFFIFLGPRCRQIAAIGFTGLMVLISLTGNYTYFNWLTIVLCIPLIPDRFWPRRIFEKLKISFHEPTLLVRRTNPVGSKIGWVGFGIRTLPLLVIALLNFQSVFSDLRNAPNPVTTIDFTPEVLDSFSQKVGGWHLVSGYGLFRTMTTTRPEIIVEGSRDGQLWTAYDFKWKTDRFDEKPRFVAPHQPRVAWQLWFAALEQGYSPRGRNAGWISNLVMKLLKGDEAVQVLFYENPFPNTPPKYIRMRQFDYEFTTREERRKSGDWWKRYRARNFLSPVSLRSN